MRLHLPRDLSTPGAALSFLHQLPAHVSTSKVVLDFGQLTFARPYATLLAAEGLRAFVRARGNRGLSTQVLQKGLLTGERESAISYLGHVGFFQYVGIHYGNAPGAALGSATYLPITEVTRANLLNETRGGVLQDAVERTSEHLAEMIFDNESQVDQLAYCLREIIRNVFEHAETNRCTVMAQKYWGDQVELAIADSGRGIQASLGGEYLTLPPEHALRDAVKPGVTRVKWQQSSGRWDNTGFGLYVCSRLGRDTGSFAIASSGALLTMTGRGESVRAAVVEGTAIRLLVSTSEAEYFPNRLAQIVDEGEAEVVRSNRGVKTASKGTRMSKR